MTDGIECACGAPVGPEGQHIDSRGELTYDPLDRRLVHLLFYRAHTIRIPVARCQICGINLWLRMHSHPWWPNDPAPRFGPNYIWNGGAKRLVDPGGAP